MLATVVAEVLHSWLFYSVVCLNQLSFNPEKDVFESVIVDGFLMTEEVHLFLM